MAEEVAVVVDLDVEPRLLEPLRSEIVRELLLGRPVPTSGSRAAADRVELLEPLEHTPHVGRSGHRQTLPRVAGPPPVGGIENP
jgi:hypothetical protein